VLVCTPATRNVCPILCRHPACGRSSSNFDMFIAVSPAPTPFNPFNRPNDQVIPNPSRCVRRNRPPNRCAQSSSRLDYYFDEEHYECLAFRNRLCVDEVDVYVNAYTTEEACALACRAGKWVEEKEHRKVLQPMRHHVWPTRRRPSTRSRAHRSSAPAHTSRRRLRPRVHSATTV
jgi:hypothetical protein